MDATPNQETHSNSNINNTQNNTSDLPKMNPKPQLNKTLQPTAVQQSVNWQGSGQKSPHRPGVVRGLQGHDTKAAQLQLQQSVNWQGSGQKSPRRPGVVRGLQGPDTKAALISADKDIRDKVSRNIRGNGEHITKKSLLHKSANIDDSRNATNGVTCSNNDLRKSDNDFEHLENGLSHSGISAEHSDNNFACSENNVQNLENSVTSLQQNVPNSECNGTDLKTRAANLDQKTRFIEEHIISEDTSVISGNNSINSENFKINIEMGHCLTQFDKTEMASPDKPLEHTEKCSEDFFQKNHGVNSEVLKDIILMDCETSESTLNRAKNIKFEINNTNCLKIPNSDGIFDKTKMASPDKPLELTEKCFEGANSEHLKDIILMDCETSESTFNRAENIFEIDNTSTENTILKNVEKNSSLFTQELDSQKTINFVPTLNAIALNSVKSIMFNDNTDLNTVRTLNTLSLKCINTVISNSNKYFNNTPIDTMEHEVSFNKPVKRISKHLQSLRKINTEQILVDKSNIKNKNAKLTKELTTLETTDSKTVKTEAIKNIKCNECEKFFASVKTLKSHASRVHPKLDCMVCNEGFNSIKDLINHSSAHDEILFACKKCKEAFTDTIDYLLHMHRHRTETKIQCEFCNKIYEKASYRNHLPTHRYCVKKCHCGKLFKSEIEFKQHLQRKHNPKFECGECDRKFTLKSYFDYHMLTHIGLKPFQCLYCGKGFYNRSAKSTHTRIHTNERPYTCDICPKAFHQTTDLIRHLERHADGPSKEKPYQCKFCPKKFRLERFMEGHLRTHTNKMLKCPECDHRCQTKTVLRSHIIYNHTNERLFACEFCEVDFKDKRGLTNHLKTIKHMATKNHVTALRAKSENDNQS